MKNYFLFLILFLNISGYSQFPPQAGLFGSTAIHKDSTIIISWADSCIVEPSWLNVADTTLGKVNLGNVSSALGYADGNVVSLGDGGTATYYFANPILNRPGFDFAIFENGFRNPTDSNLAFLELAFVSVSHDGVNYYTFPATCNNDTLVQIAGAGDYMDARKIHNFAGKYLSNYGTPFDIDDISSYYGILIDTVYFVKITDVVGSLQNEYCTRDNQKSKINDPYPTPFPSGGFDLDALAVISQMPTSITDIIADDTIQIFPNPASYYLTIQSNLVFYNYCIKSIDGKFIQQNQYEDKINISNLSAGFYFIELYSSSGSKIVQKFCKE